MNLSISGNKKVCNLKRLNSEVDNNILTKENDNILKTVSVLYVNGGLLDYGGITSYMMNYFRHIDKTKVHIDFVVHGEEKGAYDDEIIQAGSYIYYVPVKTRDYYGNVKALKKIFKTGNYQIVHAHLDAGNYHILKLAKECGVPIRIAHSHNTNFLSENGISLIINKYYRYNLKKVTTHMMACSKDAGDWLFGKGSNYEIIKNALEISHFLYSQKNRTEIRELLGISEDKIVLGNVGRFDDQKNQLFLLDVFSDLVKECSNMRLILVGDGRLRNEIEAKIKKLNLSDKVYLVGYVQNPEIYYSSFDIYVMPSKFEGLGIAALEAQINGLPCILADTIPKEVAICTNVFRIPLDKKKWINSILKIQVNRNNDNAKQIKKAGYDIEQSSLELQNKYIRMIKQGL